MTKDRLSADRHILFSGAWLHVEVWRPDAAVLFASFDHWRRDRAGFAPWEPSRTVARLGFAELIIRTAHNDWFVNPDLPAVRRALRDFTVNYDAVRCFAFSMGAYAALLLSRPLHLGSAVLVSPQWSIFPDMPPFDRRYAAEARTVDRQKADLSGQIRRAMRGVVLYDPSLAADRGHATLITAAAPGLVGLAMPFFGHPATEVIAGTDAYADLWRMAHRGEVNAAAYRAVRVRARASSELYRARLQAGLAARSRRRSDRQT